MTTATLPTLTAEQLGVIDYVMSELKPNTTIAIAGPAGSGKTTLVRELVRRLQETDEMVIVSAATNKAAMVLNRKGLQAVTLHQATMKPRFRPPLNVLHATIEKSAENPRINVFPKRLFDEYGEAALYQAVEIFKTSGISSALRHLGITDMFRYLEGWDPAPQSEGTLIIDEASMIGGTELDIVGRVFNKIILVGDEFQLPPINSAKAFWLVEKRARLTQIHRQAEGSRVLDLATIIRTSLPGGIEIDSDKVGPVDIELCRQGMPVIVWRNKCRINLTSSIRDRLGYGNMGPQPGEVLICRNASDRAAKMRGLINNSIWMVKSVNSRLECDLEDDAGHMLKNEPVYIEELDKGYGVPFRFGYALTAHNAQGSEWPIVQIYYPDAKSYLYVNPEESLHWLYTAVTRAQHDVRWVERVR